jgi:hypothetical protein
MNRQSADLWEADNEGGILSHTTKPLVPQIVAEDDRRINAIFNLRIHESARALAGNRLDTKGTVGASIEKTASQMILEALRDQQPMRNRKCRDSR